MAVIEIETLVRAPVERVFDLARSVDLHVESTARTGERAVGGVVSGLLGLGEEVTWRARQFGVWQRVSSRITMYERPVHFRDSMVRGAFRRFDHDHFFAAEGAGTVMRDVFDFTSPGGWLGWLAERAFLTRYLRALLVRRNQAIKETAESGRWAAYLERRAGAAGE